MNVFLLVQDWMLFIVLLFFPFFLKSFLLLSLFFQVTLSYEHLLCLNSKSFVLSFQFLLMGMFMGFLSFVNNLFHFFYVLRSLRLLERLLFFTWTFTWFSLLSFGHWFLLFFVFLGLYVLDLIVNLIVLVDWRIQLFLSLWIKWHWFCFK